MKRTSIVVVAVLCAASAASCVVGTGTGAPPPPPHGGPPPQHMGAHPAYLHALSDLREARANVERRGGDPEMRWDENTAEREIDAAINEIKGASIDDGKNLNEHPPVDARMDRFGRLHHALDLLRSAQRDIEEREDNTFANGLRGRATQHISEAANFVEQGISNGAGAPVPHPMGGEPPPRPMPIEQRPMPIQPRAHPAYLHALSDLREARANVARRGGDPEMRWDENTAIREIDAAINEIKMASIDDGKGLEVHPPIDARMDRFGRLHHALDLLRGAQRDIEQREDNNFANGLRARATQHIAAAANFVEQGVANGQVIERRR